jgi:hypothetical protein
MIFLAGHDGQKGGELIWRRKDPCTALAAVAVRSLKRSTAGKAVVAAAPKPPL